ncbi:hypothetical protein [Paenibacillus agilis]|uniref:Uncharacterized protein n=1 Tax=Paenibacillus agilis TaxID=3020863 RepID=A0A559ID25_9BACL|nr:hypothetical protein [Paenibacillus agilis]TVX85569.1 hypothetical protein FPZ44_24755 [Paenibacillus agilis]
MSIKENEISNGCGTRGMLQETVLLYKWTSYFDDGDVLVIFMLRPVCEDDSTDGGVIDDGGKLYIMPQGYSLETSRFSGEKYIVDTIGTSVEYIDMDDNGMPVLMSIEGDKVLCLA